MATPHTKRSRSPNPPSPRKRVWLGRCEAKMPFALHVANSLHEFTTYQGLSTQQLRPAIWFLQFVGRYIVWLSYVYDRRTLSHASDGLKSSIINLFLIVDVVV